MDEKLNKIIDSLKQSAKVELEYSKLTLSEKMSILLARAIIVLVLLVFASCALFLLQWGLLHWLTKITSLWVAVLISLAILLLILLVLYGYRKQLVINPVTRFVTKLLLNPEE